MRGMSQDYPCNVPILDQYTSKIKGSTHTQALALDLLPPKVTCDNFQRMLTGILPNTSRFDFAPTDKSKIKITSEELDSCDFCLLLKYIRRIVGGNAMAEFR